MQALALLDAPGTTLRGLPAGASGPGRTGLAEAQVVNAVTGEKTRLSDECATDLVVSRQVVKLRRERVGDAHWLVFEAAPDESEEPR
ncbi:MAG: hypothetical protein AAF170_14605, partial [Bacteroidota bacterium]